MIRSNNFNTGSNGGAVTAGNSGGANGDAFSFVNGSVTYTNSQAGGSRGDLVCSIPASSSANIGWDSFSITGRTFYWRLYMYLATSPNATRDFAYAIASGGFPTVATLSFTSADRVQLVNNATDQQLVTASAIALNQWIRIEAMVTVGTTTSNGTCEIRLYNTADSSTATDTVSGSSKDFGTDLPAMAIVEGNSQYGYLLDSLVFTDEGWPGSDLAGVMPKPIVANPLNAVRRAAFF